MNLYDEITADLAKQAEWVPVPTTIKLDEADIYEAEIMSKYFGLSRSEIFRRCIRYGLADLANALADADTGDFDFDKEWKKAAKIAGKAARGAK